MGDIGLDLWMERLEQFRSVLDAYKLEEQGMGPIQ